MLMSSQIFLRYTLFFCAILVSILILGSVYIFIPSAKDEQFYQQLTTSKQVIPLESNPSSTIRQSRQQNLKNFIFDKNGERLQIILKSQQATLEIAQRLKNKTSIMERMQGVTCLMQEELFYLLPNKREIFKGSEQTLILKNGKKLEKFFLNELKSNLIPMQKIRYLKADQATYFYDKEYLTANQVTIYHFTVPGHRVVNSIENLKPSMTGLAQTVHLFFNQKEQQFKAEGFKALFYQNQGEK